MSSRKLDDASPIYNISARAVHASFRKTAQKFAGALSGRNSYSPHSLRAAFRTFLSDHKVDPLYRILDEPQITRTTTRIHKQKQRKLETNIPTTSRTMANTTHNKKKTPAFSLQLIEVVIVWAWHYVKLKRKADQYCLRMHNMFTDSRGEAGAQRPKIFPLMFEIDKHD